MYVMEELCQSQAAAWGQRDVYTFKCTPADLLVLQISLGKTTALEVITFGGELLLQLCEAYLPLALCHDGSVESRSCGA